MFMNTTNKNLCILSHMNSAILFPLNKIVKLLVIGGSLSLKNEETVSPNKNIHHRVINVLQKI